MPFSRLILIGPSGVGKSLVGASLAQHLGYRLFDVDQDIAATSGVDISWIFDKEGEAGFRQRELTALKRGLAMDKAVIATGAGIVTTPACYELIKNTDAAVIYLAASSALLYQRLRHSSNRPMLHGGDMRNKIEQMLAEREPLYQQLADYRIHCDQQKPHVLIKRVLEHVQS